MQIVEPGIATVGNGEGRLDRKRVCFLYDVNLHKLQPGTLTLLFLSLSALLASQAPKEYYHQKATITISLMLQCDDKTTEEVLLALRILDAPSSRNCVTN